MINSTNKFPHLDDISPTPENILNIPVDSITDEHLHTLKTNLKIALNNSNQEVVDAAASVIWRIDWIIGLWKTKISWEIMEAANNLDYDLAS